MVDVNPSDLNQRSNKTSLDTSPTDDNEDLLNKKTDKSLRGRPGIISVTKKLSVGSI